MEFEKTECLRDFNELEIRCLFNNFKDYYFNHSTLTKDPCPRELSEVLENLFQSIISCDYIKILKLNLGEILFRSYDKDDCRNDIEHFFKKLSSDKESFLHAKQVIVLLIGVSALQEFIRINILGPKVRDTEDYQIVSDVFPDTSDEEIIRKLSRDGEFIYPNVMQPKLLYLSQLFLSNLRQTLCISQQWWLVRCLFIHQQMLPDRCASLHNEISALIKDILQSDWINRDYNVSTKLFLCIETVHIFLYYHEVAEAKKCLINAQDITGLEIELSGALGKKTQFQQKAVAQLFVKIKRSHSKLTDTLMLEKSDSFPPDIVLQDDTLLNKVAFIDNDENLVHDLLIEEQIVLLGYCCYVNKSEAFDKLLLEELLSYINCLLCQPKVWSLYLKALIMRCKIDKGSSRRIERAIMQMEAIVDSIRNDQPSFEKRQIMFYCSSLPASWLLERDLADLLLSVGATKSALDIYERLQLWEDIVTCYQMLGRTNCAEEIVQQQLQKEETPMLWCLLGDVMDDPDNYIKAWELSEYKSARAQRSLGYYYFKRKDYPKCIPYFLKSLEINHLQPNVWFSVGYAATQREDFELAAQAYRQVVILDQDNFEAWNNLSNAYIKTKQKVRAWKSLKEALRCNYEEWRVWENFLVVSIDIGAFEDVLRAWHRLLDIKGKHKDSEVLEILVKAITNELPDINGVTSARLKRRALQLLGRLTSLITNDSKIWELYSLLYCPNTNSINDEESLEKAILYQQKAVRCYQNVQWENNFNQCKEVLNIASRLAEMSLVYIRLLEDKLRDQQKASAKLALQNVINRTEKHLDDFQIHEKIELEGMLSSLKQFLCEITIL